MMKKAVSILIAVMMIFSLAACGQSTPNGNNKDSVSSNESVQSSSKTSDKSQVPVNGGKTLIVYFSWSTSGNTEKMANTIKEYIQAGDILEIEPETPYPTDYNECSDVAKIERNENTRPQIANLPESIDEYDTIFIGYPIWWHTAPMIIGTFLESVDLSGKDIYPFTQSVSMNTEQFENSMDFVQECAKGATVHDGLFVNASDTDGIVAYLTKNGFAE